MEETVMLELTPQQRADIKKQIGFELQEIYLSKRSLNKLRVFRLSLNEEQQQLLEEKLGQKVRELTVTRSVAHGSLMPDTVSDHLRVCGAVKTKGGMLREKVSVFMLVLVLFAVAFFGCEKTGCRTLCAACCDAAAPDLRLLRPVPAKPAKK